MLDLNALMEIGHKIKINDIEDAINDLNKAIELNPNDANAHLLRGKAKLGLNQYKNAIDDFSKAIELDVRGPLTPPLHITYAKIGEAKLGLKQYKNAIDDYSKAIELNPNDTNAYFYRGFAKRGLKDYQGSREDFTKAEEIDPKNCDSSHQLMARWNLREYQEEIKKELQKYQESVDDLTKLLEMYPNDVNTLLLRASAKRKLGDKEGAAEDDRKAKKLKNNL